MITRRIKQFILAFFMMIAIGIAASPFIGESLFASAGFDFCGDLGAGMNTKWSVDTAGLTAGDASNRKWTVQELFDGSMKFTVYNGEGDGTWYFANTSEREVTTPGYDDAAVQEKVTGVRNIGRCMTKDIVSGGPNFILGFASWITKLARQMTSKMFSANLICTNGNTSGCIPLLGVIGGEGTSGGGIIGSLRDSVFAPLAVVAFLFVAGWVAYKGLIKREFRVSLMGVLWAVGVFLIGGIALQVPGLLAGAPQTINSTISTCIVGAMNGQSCINGNVTAPSSLVAEECRSDANATGNEGAELAVNAMSCSIWKSFVLDAWSRAEFGYSYSDLYLSNPPADGTIWEGTPDDISPYAVSLQSATSSNDVKNGTIVTSGGTPIYNLALYQLYISTNMKYTGDSQYTDSGEDLRWYNIIVPAAKDTTMWSRWSPSDGSGAIRIAIAMSAVVVATAVSISLILFSFWGLVYIFAGTILMAFAPLFLLIAIEPGKGRRIFLGWLETVISSILKFMASALFVIVAISLYAAILNSTDNYVSGFIGTMIMVGVMFMYRKEIVNLMGMTSLGGQKLTNAVGEKITKKSKDTKEFATIVGGSAVGGAIGAALTKDSTFGDIARGAGSGLGEGTKRTLRRQRNIVGGAVSQLDSAKRNTERDINDRKKYEEKLAEEQKRQAEEARQQSLINNSSTNKKSPVNTGTSTDEVTKDSSTEEIQQKLDKIQDKDSKENVSIDNSELTPDELNKLNQTDAALSGSSSSNFNKAANQVIRDNPSVGPTPRRVNTRPNVPTQSQGPTGQDRSAERNLDSNNSQPNKPTRSSNADRIEKERLRNQLNENQSKPVNVGQKQQEINPTVTNLKPGDEKVTHDNTIDNEIDYKSTERNQNSATPPKAQVEPKPLNKQKPIKFTNINTGNTENLDSQNEVKETIERNLDETKNNITDGLNNRDVEITTRHIETPKTSQDTKTTLPDLDAIDKNDDE